MRRLLAIRERGTRDDVLDLLLSSEEASHAAFLVAAEPGLSRFSKGFPAEVVDQLADDDQDKGNRVHPVDGVVKDLDADADAPEIHGEQGDVEEGRGGKTEEQRGQAVE